MWERRWWLWATDFVQPGIGADQKKFKKNFKFDRSVASGLGKNAGWAQLYDGEPVRMGPEELVRVAAVAPGARLIASHMDAVNHARLDRAVLRAFVESRGL